MAEIRVDMLCKYCLGCVKLESNFGGTRNCKSFVPGNQNWRGMYEKSLKEKLEKR